MSCCASCNFRSQVIMETPFHVFPNKVKPNLYFHNQPPDFIPDFFCSLLQHVDDHSIIMADQTVIKKGKHILVFNHDAKKNRKKCSLGYMCLFVQPHKDAVITGKGWKCTVRSVFERSIISIAACHERSLVFALALRTTITR